jgi:hypothetical protein
LKIYLAEASTTARCGTSIHTSCAPQEQDSQISRFENLAEPKKSFELASFQDLELFLLQISRFRNLEVVRAMALGRFSYGRKRLTGEIGTWSKEMPILIPAQGKRAHGTEVEVYVAHEVVTGRAQGSGQKGTGQRQRTWHRAKGHWAQVTGHTLTE